MGKSAAAPGPLNDKALGRNLQLGSMFDGRWHTISQISNVNSNLCLFKRGNKYFSDTSFWEPGTINAEAFEYNHKEVKTEYSDSKTVHQKMQSFSVDAHFSLDLLGLLQILLLMKKHNWCCSRWFDKHQRLCCICSKNCWHRYWGSRGIRQSF